MGGKEIHGLETPEITLKEIIAACEPDVLGALPADASFRWIERNSREVKLGDLFIAIRGERFDGHDFVLGAAQNGASAALVSRAWAAKQSNSLLPLIAVDNPVEALQRIAAARRATMDMTVVGITGSVGKSSTKEVVASVLRQRFRTYHSPGNMNSEIGVPLSLLEIEPGTEMAVLEMGGAYAFGELALLARIAKPRISVVTNVHPVHIERMGTIENIAITKAELVEAVPPGGVAVLNGDDHRVRAMAPLCKGSVIFVGRGEGNDFWADEVETHGPAGVSFRLHQGDRSWPVRSPLVGGHAVELALIAVGVATSLGMTVDECLPGLEGDAAQIRLLLTDGPGGSKLIDDTYNASAPSVLSALTVLAETPADRRIAVLGDMRELGEFSEQQHEAVGKRAAQVADLVITYGELARTIARAATSQAAVDGRKVDVTSFALEDRAEMIGHLRGMLREGDVALLKGSRGLQMEDFVRALAPESTAAAS